MTNHEAYSTLQKKVCDGSLDRAITFYMENGGADISGTISASTNTRTGTRRSRTPSDDGFNNIDQDEELARSLQEQDAKSSSIRAPIAPRHEMLLGDDYGGSSMFGGSTRKLKKIDNMTCTSCHTLALHFAQLCLLPLLSDKK